MRTEHGLEPARRADHRELSQQAQGLLPHPRDPRSPATLTIGRTRLKVIMKDKTTGHQDEGDHPAGDCRRCTGRGGELSGHRCPKRALRRTAAASASSAPLRVGLSGLGLAVGVDGILEQPGRPDGGPGRLGRGEDGLFGIAPEAEFAGQGPGVFPGAQAAEAPWSLRPGQRWPRGFSGRGSRESSVSSRSLVSEAAALPRIRTLWMTQALLIAGATDHFDDGGRE